MGLPFYGQTVLKQRLICSAERILSCEVSDPVLMKLYARFQSEEHKKNDSKYPPLPSSLRLGRNAFKSPIPGDYEQTKKQFLEACPDVFSFLKFVLCDVIFDYSLVEDILKDIGITRSITATELALVFPIFILPDRDNSSIENDRKLFAEIINELRESKLHKLVQVKHVSMFKLAMTGHCLNPEYGFSVSHEKTEVVISAATDSVRIIKDDLNVTSIYDQMKICVEYYSGARTASILFSRFERLTRDKHHTIQFKNNRNDDKETKTILTKLISYLAKTNPQFVLESIYRETKTYRNPVTGEEKISTRRPALTELECGMIYDLFTKSIEKTETTLIVFPSPFFVRKYSTDKLINKTRTVFIVPSDAEKDLYKLMFGYNKYLSRQEQYSFVTVSDYLRNPDKQVSKILVFALTYEEHLYEGIERNLPSLCQCLCIKHKGADIITLCLNSSFKAENGFSNRFVYHGNRIQKILFLPNSIENEVSKKNIWFGTIGKKKDNNESSAVCYKAEKKSSLILNREITVSETKYTLCFQQYLKEGKKPDIFTFAKKGTIPQPTETYEQSIPFEFSEEIKIWYRTYDLKKYPGKVKCSAYFADRNEVEGTRVFKTLTPDKIEEWLSKGYAFEKIEKRKKEDKVTSVRENIVPIIKERFKELPVSLKTFVYVYPEFEEMLSNEEKAFLEFVAFEDPFGKLSMDIITEELYREEFEKYQDFIIDGCYKVLDKVLQYAVEKKHLSQHPFSSSVDDDTLRRSNTRALANVRSVLATKTFTVNQFRDFNKRVKGKIAKGDICALGVYIKALTGLETKTIAALQWDDFHRDNDFVTYSLKVYKYCSSSTEKEKRFALFDNNRKFRYIPCTSELAKVIRSIKPKTDKEFIFMKDGEQITPRAINQKFKEILEEMNLPKIAEQTTIDDSISFSDYGGDFARENFRYYASDVAGLTADEIAYILGNKPPTTFGAHYCDYHNPASQYVLATKLNRINALLEKENLFSKPKPAHISDSGEYVFRNDKSSNPIQLNIVKKNEYKVKEIKIDVSSSYGVRIYNNEEC